MFRIEPKALWSGRGLAMVGLTLGNLAAILPPS